MVGDNGREVVLEVRRHGRRPRYHRGYQLDNGLVVDPPQCNVDDAALERRVLDALPATIRRPWAQLCLRCWEGRPELTAAWDAAVATGGRSLPRTEVMA